MSETLIPAGVLKAGGILDRIVEAKATRAQNSDLASDIEQAANSRARSRASSSFAEALSRKNRASIIAEIKRRSPSKGVICEDFDPVRIAEQYRRAGAAALSVLTEEDFFGGSLDHLRAVRERVDLPLLRKDFIFDARQIYESAAAGADAVLLIAAILADELLKRLIDAAGEQGLDALVEVHTSEQMQRAAGAGARIMGVNNRDLVSFAVDLDTSIQLATVAPRDAILVSESGINTGADIRRLRSAGYHAFLIGEHFMRAKQPGAALSRLIGDVESPRASGE